MNPDEIVKPGTPQTAWITPDGKFITTDPDAAKANGATHQVTATNVVFADGRKQWIVFTSDDRTMAPGTYSPAGPQMGFDENQRRIWQQGQNQQQRGDQEGDTRGPQNGPNREVYRGGRWIVEPNPLYQPSQGSTQKPPGGREGTEGTPDPNAPGGVDNERPRWVVRDANGNEVWARPLTDAEAKQWREDRERSRNPGRKTDQQIADEQRQAQQDRVGKPTGNTRTRSANGTTVKETEYLLPDGRTEWRSQTETTQPDQVGKPTGNTRTRTANGQTVKEVEYVLPDGKREWRSQSESTPNPPASADDYTPDITKPQMGLSEYRQKLAQLRASGAITEEQYITRAQRAYEAAVAEAKRLDTLVSAQQAAAQDLITQRGQDQQASVSRLGQANQATATALSESRQFAGQMTPEGVAAAGGPILPAIMALQDARGQAWGGFHTPPTVTTGQFPAWNQMAGMGIGATAPGGAAPPSAPTPPNAIGLGNVGAVQAPGALPAPLLGPQPVTAPVAPPAAAAAGAPAVAAPAMAAPAPVPDAGAPYNPAQASPLTVPQNTPVNPAPGQPGHDPTRPIGMAPPQTLMAFASMDPLLGPLLAANDDPDYAEALMTVARNKGLA